jgi:hypothetical protein
MPGVHRASIPSPADGVPALLSKRFTIRPVTVVTRSTPCSTSQTIHRTQKVHQIVLPSRRRTRSQGLNDHHAYHKSLNTVFLVPGVRTPATRRPFLHLTLISLVEKLNI